MNHHPAASLRHGLCIWPGMIFVLIGINVCIVAITVYFAHSDRSVVIERDYDRKALAWNQIAQQNLRNRELGWNVSLGIDPVDPTSATMTVRITDAEQQPIERALVNATVFPSVRASQVQQLTLIENSPGRYQAALDHSRPGLWECRLIIRRGDDIFTASIEHMVEPNREGH